MEIKQEHRAFFNEIVSKIDKKEYKCCVENGKVGLYIEYYVGSDWIMYYYSENNQMWLNYWGLRQKFEFKFGLNHDQITEITSAMVEEHTKFKGVTTNCR